MNNHDAYAPLDSGRVSPSHPRESRSSSDSTLVGWSYTANEAGKIITWTESYVSNRRSDEVAQNDSRDDIEKTSSQNGELVINTSMDGLTRGIFKMKVAYGLPKNLDPESNDFMITEDDWAREEAPDRRFVSKEAAFFGSLLAKSDATVDHGPPKQPASTPWTNQPIKATKPVEANKPTLIHPLTYSPWTSLDRLPYKEYTDTTPVCAAMGHYHSRLKSSQPTHQMMTSDNFTLIIRFEGPFDSSGRQPGLMIQTKHFTVRVMEKGFIPGERKVEIFRNGETFQLNGLIGVMADECAWFLGDKDLRREGEGYVGREEGRRLARKCGLGEGSSGGDAAAVGAVREP